MSSGIIYKPADGDGDGLIIGSYTRSRIILRLENGLTLQDVLGKFGWINKDANYLLGIKEWGKYDEEIENMNARVPGSLVPVAAGLHETKLRYRLKDRKDIACFRRRGCVYLMRLAEGITIPPIKRKTKNLKIEPMLIKARELQSGETYEVKTEVGPRDARNFRSYAIRHGVNAVLIHNEGKWFLWKKEYNPFSKKI